MYRITLSDGTILDNIDVNGTTLISRIPLDEKTFEHNMSPVIFERIGERSAIDMTDLEGTHENMEYVNILSSNDSEYWFALMDIPESEMQYSKIQADIEYISMMTGVDL